MQASPKDPSPIAQTDIGNLQANRYIILGVNAHIPAFYMLQYYHVNSTCKINKSDDNIKPFIQHKHITFL